MPKFKKSNETFLMIFKHRAFLLDVKNRSNVSSRHFLCCFTDVIEKSFTFGKISVCGRYLNLDRTQNHIFNLLFLVCSDGFDILVNDCYAHNGANKKIQLIDHHGCPVDDKLISRFQGTWGMTDNMYDTLVYAHMKTFRFTGTPALYIECDIRMCHGKCPVRKMITT